MYYYIWVSKMIQKVLSENLKRFRAKNNINQFEFANDCGFSKETLSLIERGQENVTIEILDLIAAKTGYTIPQLLSPQIQYIVIHSKADGFTTYGIGAIKDGEMVDFILDVIADYNKIKFLVDQFNYQELDLCHLHDVVDDYLVHGEKFF